MLPSYYPSLTTPDSNLASGLEATPIHYMAFDGSGIGYGNRCAGLACEPSLNGLDGYFDTVRDIANFGSGWGVALLSAAHGYRRRRNLFTALAWGFAGYAAPLPLAAVVLVNEAGIELFPKHW